MAFYETLQTMKKVVLFLLPLFLWAHPPTWTTPWFTGPLLAPSASTSPRGVVTWQPYLFVTNSYGVFTQDWGREKTPNTWVIQPLVDVTYGLTPFMDIEATPVFSYTLREGSSAVRMNDTPLFIGFQVLRDQEGGWMPDLRITLQQLFPLGQYDHLNPKKKGTDGSGKGSYRTGINFNFQKIFKIAEEHYFRLRTSCGTFFYSSPPHIQGLSSYGGASDTNGKIYPGERFDLFVSGEYTITHQWGFAFDTLYVLELKDRFTGKRGTTSKGKVARVGESIRQQISFAPAVEYNFSENFGIIGGAWFTLAGQNAPQFFTGTLSAVISY